MRLIAHRANINGRIKEKENRLEQIKFCIIIWSVIPSILAITILTMKSNFSLLLLSMGFLLCQLVDEICYKFLLFPSWYLPLRRTLTLFVVLILINSYFIMQTP